MNATNPTPEATERKPTILIATDNPAVAALLRHLLRQEYERVHVSTDAGMAAEDFDSYAPDLLALAFSTLEKSKRHYVRLYRLSRKIHLQPHRAIVLCNEDEVSRAYQDCRSEYFNDYIPFWPMTDDGPRLLVSVHQALLDLAEMKDLPPTSAQFATRARKLFDMENQMHQQMAVGTRHVQTVSRLVLELEHEIDAALGALADKLPVDEHRHISGIPNIAELEQQLNHIKLQVGAGFRAAVEALKPIRHWTEEFSQACAPHLESVHALNTFAERMQDRVPLADSVIDSDYRQHPQGMSLQRMGGDRP
jgi:CheY-like chemotaxis protein